MNKNLEHVFNDIKELICNAQTLVYFDRKQKIVIQTQSSLNGIGFSLFEKGIPYHMCQDRL